MKLNMKHWCSSIVVVGVVVALLGSTIAFAANPNPGVLPPQSHPHGHTYNEWNVKWWQWAFSIPTDKNPLFDQTGADCGQGQSGSVWFLAGTFNGGPAVRSCTIPTGKALFIPIANTERDSICPVITPPETVAALQQEAQVFLDSFAQPKTQLAAQVDGEDIQQLQQTYKVGPSPSFNITLPDGNLYSGCGTQPGTYGPAVSSGYYLMLAPLHAGSHTIHFNADNTASSAPDNLKITLDVTYHLTVK